MYQIATQGKFMSFDKKPSKSSEIFYLEPDLYPSLTKNVEAMNTLFKKDTITATVTSHLKCLKGSKKLRFTMQIKDLVLPSLVGTWDIFSIAMSAMISDWCWEQRDITNPNLFTTMSAYSLSLSLMTNTDLIEYKMVGDSKSPLLPRFFKFKSHSWRRYDHWTVHQLPDL